MKRYEKALLLALKIGIGTSAAIYIAQLLRLDYAVCAGTVTLLTLMTQKWATIKLSVARLVAFITTLLMTGIIFSTSAAHGSPYGFLLTLVVFFAELLSWRATISVNAVAAAHLITNQDFSPKAIQNEFMLVLIGVALAVLLKSLSRQFLPQAADRCRYAKRGTPASGSFAGVGRLPVRRGGKPRRMAGYMQPGGSAANLY